MDPPIKFPRGEVNVKKKLPAELLNSAPHCPLAQGPGAALRGCKGSPPIELPLAEVNAKQIRLDNFLAVCLGISQLKKKRSSTASRGCKGNPPIEFSLVEVQKEIRMHPSLAVYSAVGQLILLISREIPHRLPVKQIPKSTICFTSPSPLIDCIQASSIFSQEAADDAEHGKAAMVELEVLPCSLLVGIIEIEAYSPCKVKRVTKLTGFLAIIARNDLNETSQKNEDAE